jgi:hypothetical protein
MTNEEKLKLADEILANREGWLDWYSGNGFTGSINMEVLHAIITEWKQFTQFDEKPTELFDVKKPCGCQYGLALMGYYWEGCDEHLDDGKKYERCFCGCPETVHRATASGAHYGSCMECDCEQLFIQGSYEIPRAGSPRKMRVVSFHNPPAPSVNCGKCGKIDITVGLTDGFKVICLTCAQEIYPASDFCLPTTT